MAKGDKLDSEGGYLAHISDTVTATEGKVDQLLERQEVLIGVLTRMCEDMRTQSEMLAEILGAACGEPEPSPVADLLAQLTAAVNENTNAVTEMSEELAEIPAEIGDAIVAAMSREATADA